MSLLQAADLSSLAPGRLPVRMARSEATALPLFKVGQLGADVIRFPAGGRVPDHTHIGGHVLYVLSGTGWVDYDGVPWELAPGRAYLIPPMVRHGIRAETELTLLAVADNHRPAGSGERLFVCE